MFRLWGKIDLCGRVFQLGHAQMGALVECNPIA
jgi:hypothetical protein